MTVGGHQPDFPSHSPIPCCSKRKCPSGSHYGCLVFPTCWLSSADHLRIQRGAGALRSGSVKGGGQEAGWEVTPWSPDSCGLALHALGPHTASAQRQYSHRKPLRLNTSGDSTAFRDSPDRCRRELAPGGSAGTSEPQPRWPAQSPAPAFRAVYIHEGLSSEGLPPCLGQSWRHGRQAGVTGRGAWGRLCGHPQLAREVRRAMFSRGNRGARRLSRGSRETNQSQENTCRRPA